MTIARMIELLEIEHECMLRKSHDACDSHCGVCELVQDDGQLHEMYIDVIALLKAQEPRVVKISELTSGEPMLVWLEDIDKDETVAGMINIGGMDRIYPLIEEYLTRWRCWTSRPSKEEMEATPWK